MQMSLQANVSQSECISKYDTCGINAQSSINPHDDQQICTKTCLSHSSISNISLPIQDLKCRLLFGLFDFFPLAIPEADGLVTAADGLAAAEVAAALLPGALDEAAAPVAAALLSGTLEEAAAPFPASDPVLLPSPALEVAALKAALDLVFVPFLPAAALVEAGALAALEAAALPPAPALEVGALEAALDLLFEPFLPADRVVDDGELGALEAAALPPEPAPAPLPPVPVFDDAKFPGTC
jgi:hypothetical protein